MRLADGRMLWVDAGDIQVDPLDTAVVVVDGQRLEGQVYVTPDQLGAGSPMVAGRIIGASEAAHDDGECDALPGAGLPALGSRCTVDGVEGVVVQIDPLAGTVTIAGDDGNQRTATVEL